MSPESIQTPFDPIFEEISRALEVELYYLAVVVALTLPDVCAALSDPRGRTTGARYKAWVERNLAPKYLFINPQDIYSLRCGLLHQSQTIHQDGRFGRTVISLPGASGSRVHASILGPPKAGRGDLDMAQAIMTLDAGMFCEDMISAVREWFAAHGSDLDVQANLPRLVRLRPDGLAPYVAGIPVIG